MGAEDRSRNGPAAVTRVFPKSGSRRAGPGSAGRKRLRRFHIAPAGADVAKHTTIRHGASLAENIWFETASLRFYNRSRRDTTLAEHQRSECRRASGLITINSITAENSANFIRLHSLLGSIAKKQLPTQGILPDRPHPLTTIARLFVASKATSEVDSGIVCAGDSIQRDEMGRRFQFQTSLSLAS